MQNNKEKKWRFERKFIVPSNKCFNLNEIIKNNNLFFTEKYQPRKVRSLYFDDMNLSCLSQNINGLSERKKFRMRWYGDTFGDIENAHFECKFKKIPVIQKKFGI